MMSRNRLCMYAMALLQGMVFYGPIATLYRQARGVTVMELALIESISLILCLALEFPWGILADRLGYCRTLRFCCLIYALSKLVFWRAESFFGFLLERVLLSVVLSGFSGVDSALLYLSAKPEYSQKTFGIYNSLSTAGLFLAALAFSTVLKGSYQAAAFGTVIAYALAFLCSLGLSEPQQRLDGTAAVRGGGRLKAALKETLKNRWFLLFLLAAALFNETHQTITVFLNQLQYAACGISDPAMGWLYMAVTAAGLLGAASSRLTEALGRVRLACGLFLLAALSCLLLALTKSAWLSAAAVLTLRIAFSLFTPLQMELQNRQIRGAGRAAVLSLHAVALDLVGAGTNLSFGRAAERSLSGAFLLGAGFSLTALLLFLLWDKRR